MSGQLRLIQDYDLWVMGCTFECVMGKGECRFAPCTTAQDVRCCKDCTTKCTSQCPRTKGKRCTTA